MAKRLVVSKD